MSLWGGGGGIDMDNLDGWDDDDLLDDVDMTEEESATESHVQNVPTPPLDINNHSGGTTQLGGGLFMGRLAKFIETATQPDEEEEEDRKKQDAPPTGSFPQQQSLAQRLSHYLSPSTTGWDEDDDTLGLEDEEDGENEGGWGDDDLDGLVDNDDDEEDVAEIPEPPEPVKTQSFQTKSYEWNNSVPENSAPSSVNAFSIATNDAAAEVPNDRAQHSLPQEGDHGSNGLLIKPALEDAIDQHQTPEESPSVGGGWDDAELEDALDDVPLTQDDDDEPPQTPQPPMMQEIPVRDQAYPTGDDELVGKPKPSIVEKASPLSSQEGWDDFDVDLGETKPQTSDDVLGSYAQTIAIKPEEEENHVQNTSSEVLRHEEGESDGSQANMSDGWDEDDMDLPDDVIDVAAEPKDTTRDEGTVCETFGNVSNEPAAVPNEAVVAAHPLGLPNSSDDGQTQIDDEEKGTLHAETLAESTDDDDDDDDGWDEPEIELGGDQELDVDHDTSVAIHQCDGDGVKMGMENGTYNVDIHPPKEDDNEEKLDPDARGFEAKKLEGGTNLNYPVAVQHDEGPASRNIDPGEDVSNRNNTMEPALEKEIAEDENDCVAPTHPDDYAVETPDIPVRLSTGNSQGDLDSPSPLQNSQTILPQNGQNSVALNMEADNHAGDNHANSNNILDQRALASSTALGIELGGGNVTDVEDPGWDHDELNDLNLHDEGEGEEAEVSEEITHDPPRNGRVPARPIHPIEPSPLVDYVPTLGVHRVVQRDSTVAFGSDQSGTHLNDDTVGDLDHDEQDFGPVVDHLPPQHRSPHPRAASVITQVVADDLDRDDNEVGEDTEPGQTSEEAPASGGVRDLPPVVDQVPRETRRRNPLRDSTVAVASEQSSSVMEEIWKEDFDPDDDDYGPVVDQLPTHPTGYRNLRTMSSVAIAVQASILELEEETEEEDEAGTEEEGQIPSTEWERRPTERVSGPWSGASLADSMAVIAPIVEQGEEHTVEEDVDIHDDETLSHGMLGERVVNVGGDGPLVDHVPVRGDVRSTDASTWVVGDPSEVLTVGDLTNEDQQYGLVVDQTPPPRVSAGVSMGGSTIVAATKSECPEDLEDDIDHEDITTIRDDAATIETSACEENEPESNLVDHVPVPQRQPLRRANSASAVAEALSVISTRDDEFGLVVDQTPVNATRVVASTRDSMITLAEFPLSPVTEPADIVHVDQLSIPSSVPHRIESIRDIKSTGSEDGTLDETLVDGYGPVVDQLPNSGFGLPPSRGGSTTGALATLSEASEDDNDGDGEETTGWETFENDGDSSMRKDPQIDPISLTPETKNKSVTFLSPDGNSLPPSMPDLSSQQDETRYYDPLPRQDALSNDQSETMFHDPESGDSNAWRHENMIEQIENADKNPPSGPNDHPPGPEAASLAAATLDASDGDCPTCANATSIDCPCIKRVLYQDGNVRGPGVVQIVTPDGISVDVDYNKLLQEEMTKRLLLEKEVTKYEQLVQALDTKASKTAARLEGAYANIDQLGSTVRNLEAKLQKESRESAALRVENEGWHEKNSLLQGELLKLKEEKDQLWFAGQAQLQEARAAAEKAMEDASKSGEKNNQLHSELQLLHSQTKQLKDETNDLKAQHQRESNRSLALQSELADTKTKHEQGVFELSREHSQKEERLTGEVTVLQTQVSELSSRLETQRRDVKSLSIQKEEVLAAKKASDGTIVKFRQKEATWMKRERELSEEIVKLQKQAADSLDARDLEATFNSQLAALKLDLGEKTRQVEELSDRLKEAEALLQESKGKNATLMKESTRLSKTYEADITRLSNELTTLAKLHEEELASRDVEDSRRAEQLKSKQAELEQAHSESTDIRTMLGAKEFEEKQREITMRRIQQEKELLESRVKSLETEMVNLANENSTHKKREGELNNIAVDVQALKKARETMRNALEAKESQIRMLEGKIGELSNELQKIAVLQDQVSLLTSERDRLTRLMAEKERFIARLQREQEVSKREWDESQQRSRETDSRTESLVSEVAKLREDLQLLRKNGGEKDDELDVLKNNLAISKKDYERISEERDRLLSVCKDLEDSRELQKAEAALVSSYKTRVDELQAELKSVSSALEDAVSGQQHNQIRCQELEAKLSAESEKALHHKALETELSGVIAQVKSEKSGLEQQLGDEKQRITQLSSAHQTMQRELDMATKLAAERSELISRLEGCLQASDEEKSKLLSENETSRVRCEQLEVDVERSQAEYGSVLEQLNHRTELESKLRSDMDSLLEERDTVMQEHRVLEEENEEMLVQLGMIKEEMDANVIDLEVLRLTVRDKEKELFAAQEEARRLNEMMGRLSNGQMENGYHQPMERDEQDKIIQDLTLSNVESRQEIDDLTSSNAFKDQEISTLHDRNRELLARLDEQDSSVINESRSKHLVDEFKQRCQKLEGLCKRQKREIDQLVAKLEMSESQSVRLAGEDKSLRERISHLEDLRIDFEQALQQKDLALSQMQRRMENMHGDAAGPTTEPMANMSRHIEDLNAKLQHAELLAFQNLKKSQASQSAYELVKAELKKSREALSKTEVELLNKGLELDAQNQDSSTGELEEQLYEYRRALRERERRMEEVLLHRKELEGRLMKLESELSMERKHCSALSSEAEGISELLSTKDSQIDSLESQMASLRREYHSNVQKQKSRDQKAKKDISAMRHSAEKKKDRINGLEQQIKTLSIELSASKDMLASKEDELQRLSFDLEHTRAEHLVTTQRVTTQVLSTDMSKEEAESSDNMRTLIVSLSQALEESESQRADAIERLLRERKANADSLKRLGESVKRFYSTLSCSGSA